MSYVNAKEMLAKARKNGYAIGAFNISNLEFAQAVISAAEKTNSPVILQASESACDYAGFNNLVSIVKNIASKSSVPVALHLDHGKNFETCKKAIDAGFSSVMIDLSALSFDENIKGTKEVVKYAHKLNVTVEAELGEIVGVEDAKISNNSHFTDPTKAKQFVKETGIDSLAISIGTAHGINKGTTEPKIHFDIIKKIEEQLPDFPLVCHGASTVDSVLTEKFIEFGGVIAKSQGIPKDSLKKMSRTGICKINMDTDLRLCFSASLKEYLEKNKTVFDPRKILGNARNEITNYVCSIINDILGSANQA